MYRPKNYRVENYVAQGKGVTFEWTSPNHVVVRQARKALYFEDKYDLDAFYSWCAENRLGVQQVLREYEVSRGRKPVATKETFWLGE